jgi:membrane associated rhomboid family serine protease
MEDYNVNPFNRIPPFVLGLAIVMILVELTFLAADAGLIGGPAGTGWRIKTLSDWAFRSPVWNQMLETRHFPAHDLLRFVTYPFLHVGLGNALFGALMALALGKGVSDLVSPWAVPVVFFGTSIIGALVYGAFVSTEAALFGAYTGDFGLLGAISYARWVDLKSAGRNQIIAFRLIFVILIWQLVWSIFSHFTGQAVSYDWISLIAAFVSGFIMALVFEPGGPTRLLARIRQR